MEKQWLRILKKMRSNTFFIFSSTIILRYKCSKQGTNVARVRSNDKVNRKNSIPFSLDIIFKIVYTSSELELSLTNI
jgi:hypothetical protein